MAHLWKQDAQRQWQPVPLDAPTFDFDTRDDENDTSDPPAPAAVQLVRCGTNSAHWAVLAPPDAAVRVNGHAVQLGFRVLHDRDELVVPSERESTHAFFSTEQLAQIVPFPGSETPLKCPRCKKNIERDMPAVRCPDCGAWHHQIPEGHPGHDPRECWTYSDKCSLCPQPTALSTGYRWTPDGL